MLKRFIRGAGTESEHASRGRRYPPPVAAEPQQPALKAIARHFPDDDEIAANPRARSAVLRVAEKRAEFDA